jgi:STE24 endopeptidase
MELAKVIPVAVLVLLALRLALQLWLEHLNRKHVLAHAGAVPDAFRGVLDDATYARSVQYTLAHSGLHRVELVYDFLILIVVLFSGVLPWAYGRFTEGAAASALAGALFLYGTGVALSLPGLPMEWYHQFRLEQRFGFNTMTQKLWWLDRLKGLALGFLLGVPLLWLVLKVVGWTGSSWWLWAWAVLLAFQLLMALLAPVLILPLFNKFSPLPEGGLRERLLKLADRIRFRTRSIQVMDGSKRSRHSNAFFTGFGRFRKIVLFDTLVQQLAEPELEAVLAHEIGHYKLKHIPKMLAASAFLSLAGLFVVARLAEQPWFYRAFGFEPGSIVPALLLFALLSGLVTFWFSPLAHFFSRKHEYQADAFAARQMQEAKSLIAALRKLNEKNLSNLTPHPYYSGFYYSHPTLLEREAALQQVTAA